MKIIRAKDYQDMSRKAANIISDVYKRQVRGNAHKRFAFQQSGGQREPYPTGGLRQAACGFKGHTQVFPVRPCGHILRRKTAAVSPRRCRFDHFQLRGVFCLPAHGAEGQRFAFRSAESKLPAIRAASVRAALPQTTGALRAGSVRGPCTELVPQLIGRVCGVAVFAAAAGKNSIAVCFTGGGYGNSLIIMVQCGQLFAGGIVAAGAGFVGIPADFRTGGGFCCVLLQSMVQCGQLFAGGIVAAETGAGFVSIPADFRTGGSLRCVLLQSCLLYTSIPWSWR